MGKHFNSLLKENVCKKTHEQGLKMSDIEKIHLGFSNTPFSLSVCMHG